MDEAEIHARALRATNDRVALGLWRELAALGNPEAPERLREYARCEDHALSGPARESLEALGLSHEEPMP